MRSRVIALEEQVRAESKRARLIEQERNVLAAQVRAKVAEKEMAVAQYDDLLKKLETFLGPAKVTQANLHGDAKVQATVASLQT